MKKLVKISSLFALLFLTSCIKDENLVNKEEIYQLKDDINLNLTISDVQIINNDELLDNQIKISNKLEFELTLKDDSIDITNKVRGKNIIKLETNSNSIYNINLFAEEINISAKNKNFKNINILTNTLNLNFFKVNLNDLNLKYTLSNNFKIDNCKLNDLKSVGNKARSYKLSNSEFNEFDILNVKSETHIYDNIFNKGIINQEFGRIDGQILGKYGYTLDCKAKYLKTTYMPTIDNVYLDGSNLINFNSTNGEVELWLNL